MVTATDQSPAPVTLIHLPHTYPQSSRSLYRGVGWWSNRWSSCTRETQHGNHATQMAHWATTYIQQTVHVTQRHSYLHQSRHRDSPRDSTPPHTKCDAPLQLYVHQTHSRDWLLPVIY